MNVSELDVQGVLLIEPRVFADDRGFFMETYNAERYASLGIDRSFVQDNLSRSRRGVLRGIHLQHPHAQAKLVSVLEGEVYDVAVDVRPGSPTFGRWCGEYLSTQNKRQLFIPAGVGHGFIVTSESALFHYKCSDFYHPECERTLRWDDPQFDIRWPLEPDEVSLKDRVGMSLDEFLAELQLESRAADHTSANHNPDCGLANGLKAFK